MLKQQLKQKQLQKLTPQQIQVIKLLEIPTFQLEEKIKQELEENPILEEGRTEDDTEIEKEEEDNNDNGEEFSLEDYMQDDEIPQYKTRSNNYSEHDKGEGIPFSVDLTFHEFLKEQVCLLPLREHSKRLISYLIGNIDHDGYLRRNLQAIADDLAFNEGIEASAEEIADVLTTLQELDPPGVGARNLQECLLLQIQRKDRSEKDVDLACDILENYFDEFTKKHYDKILDRTGVTEKRLSGALNEILKLNPKPGTSFGDSARNENHENIIPDFILNNQDEIMTLSLNAKNIPDLQINRSYAEILHKRGKKISSKEKETMMFVKQKMNSAQWFIEAIRQRQKTMMDTMNAILDFQHDYFVEGDEALLKPMILKDIANITGYDISTISRVVSSKYIQTHFGTFSLKYFFSEGLQKEDGEEASSREIKYILKESIEKENKKRPLTDEKLTSILREKGYAIARRTVAKYREQMQIPVARLRKGL
jgi:RNA polymerase sigma-54 factor